MKLELLPMTAALVAGLVLGIFYFSLLWLTVRRIPCSAHPAMLVLGSLAGRLTAVIAIFYLVVMDGHWERLIACLVGFLIVRQVMTLRIRPRGTQSDPREKRMSA